MLSISPYVIEDGEPGIYDITTAISNANTINVDTNILLRYKRLGSVNWSLVINSELNIPTTGYTATNGVGLAQYQDQIETTYNFELYINNVLADTLNKTVYQILEEI